METVSRGKYGDFSDDKPFNTKVPEKLPFIVNRPLPEEVQNMETKYFLFTKKNPDKYEELSDNPDANKLKDSNYDGAKMTFLIIHGWKGKTTCPAETNTQQRNYNKKENLITHRRVFKFLQSFYNILLGTLHRVTV